MLKLGLDSFRIAIMQSSEIRQKFLEFFKSIGHVVVPSSSLIPDNDPSVLLTTAGMQQFKPYFQGLKSPEEDFGSRKLASIQKSFRTSDINEVGDNTHHTFFEMLGNFAIGDYFKKEAIVYAWDFVTKELGLSEDRLFVTVFAGSEGVPEDKEAYQIWQKTVPGVEIRKLGRTDNFWGPPGDSGPCGPSSEIYYKTHSGEVEIWNLVFTEYDSDKEGQLSPLSQKNIDTGLGMERLVSILQGKESAYETDLFLPIITAIEELVEVGGKENKAIKSVKIMSDHIRGAVFLSADGVIPSNVGRGYVLRRLIRRAIMHGQLMSINGRFLATLAEPVIDSYSGSYPELKTNKQTVITMLEDEEAKFDQTLKNGLKEFAKFEQKGSISSEEAFRLFQSFGFPVELTTDLAKQKKLSANTDEFEKYFLEHQEKSRGGEKEYKGGLAEVSERTTRMHTATHLLHQALRTVLGDGVAQKGSNITNDRLRFDFSYSNKLTQEQLQQVQDLVNEKINKGLEVTREEMSLEEAKKSGAIGLFEQKYGDKVSVYTIGDFSKEFCGGPHVTNTKEIGLFKIQKEEAVASGIRRIKATVT